MATKTVPDNLHPVDQTSPSFSVHFFVLRDDETSGPFDLIELAGQLKVSQIDANTPIRGEGVDEWKPFRELPEFAAAQEISIEVIALHLEKKERVGDSTPALKKASAQWETAAIVLALLVLAGVIFFFSTRQPPAPPPPDATFTFPQQYSAETRSMIGVSGSQPITGRIYKDGGKVRTEVDSMGGDGVFINRPDLGKVYQLHASTKTFTEKPYKGDMDDLGVTGPHIHFLAMNPVLDDGVTCEQYMININGERSLVLVRPDSHAPIWLVTDNGMVTIEYSHFKAGPPAAALFELPADYHISK